MSNTYKDRSLFVDRLERKFQRKIHALNARKSKEDDERTQQNWDVYLYIDENDEENSGGQSANRRREIREW